VLPATHRRRTAAQRSTAQHSVLGRGTAFQVALAALAELLLASRHLVDRPCTANGAESALVTLCAQTPQCCLQHTEDTQHSSSSATGRQYAGSEPRSLSPLLAGHTRHGYSIIPVAASKPQACAIVHTAQQRVLRREPLFRWRSQALAESSAGFSRQ
jgi:hypothetical protein